MLRVASASSGSAGEPSQGTDKGTAKAAAKETAQESAQKSGLTATVDLSRENSQVYLENTGQTELHRVRVIGAGKNLGILSKLMPGEKKVLAVSGQASDIAVSAIDPSDKEIDGFVQYIQPNFPAPSSASVEVEVPLGTMSAPESPEVSGQVFDKSESTNASPLALTISVNKTEGREGEVVGFRCTARNAGIEELSKIKIICAGKMASTNYLTSGKELYLDGAAIIRDSFELSAGVEGQNAGGQIFTNNTSVEIWKVSPEISLTVEAPGKVHRNDIAAIRARVENIGSSSLTGIVVSDVFGELGRLDSLGPGEFQVLQKDRTISESLRGEVRVLAKNGAGREVYASRSLEIEVRNSSLQLDGQPGEVRAYPGEPAEVTWVLSNTGEETLKNITLSGEGKGCTLPELLPGKSVRMAAIYNKSSSTMICVTAHGVDETGFAAESNASVLIKAITPGIGLK
ncbi:MAG: hypothetical protein EHM14_15155, partial [Methanothrix sp.]